MRERQLWKKLRRHHVKRWRRHQRRSRGMRIPPERRIARRPQDIAARRIAGHWEADLVMFRAALNGQRNVMTLVERTTRFVRLARLEDRASRGVARAMQALTAHLPAPLRQSVTCDQGSEFVTFTATEKTTGMTVWFCDPRSPWQKGSVENMNGRLRQFLPMDTLLPSIGPSALRAIEARMNATPRKCLGYLTPAEAMDRLIESVSPGGAAPPYGSAAPPGPAFP